MKKILIVCFFISSFSFAEKGQETGGACVVSKDKKNVLFDFYENGIERPYISDQKDVMKVKDIIDSNFSHLKDGMKVSKAVTNKLNEIYTILPPLAIKLFHYITDYTWHVIRPDVINSNDIGKTLIKQKECQWIAVRDDNYLKIKINSKLWSNMKSLEQKIGLVFHEAIYGMMVQEKKAVDSSYEVRSLNAYLFTEKFTKLPAKKVQKRFYKISGFIFAHYEEYHDSQTDIYKKKCHQFIIEVEESLKSYAESLKYAGFITPVDRGHDWDDDIYRKLITVYIQGKPYLFPFSSHYKYFILMTGHYGGYAAFAKGLELFRGRPYGHYLSNAPRYDYTYEYGYLQKRQNAISYYILEGKALYEKIYEEFHGLCLPEEYRKILESLNRINVQVSSERPSKEDSKIHKPRAYNGPP